MRGAWLEIFLRLRGNEKHGATVATARAGERTGLNGLDARPSSRHLSGASHLSVRPVRSPLKGTVQRGRLRLRPRGLRRPSADDHPGGRPEFDAPGFEVVGDMDEVLQVAAQLVLPSQDQACRRGRGCNAPLNFPNPLFLTALSSRGNAYQKNRVTPHGYAEASLGHIL